MTAPKQVSFDEYLDSVFASPIWLDACVNMLSVFLEDVDACREKPEQDLPGLAPSIVDQVAAVADRTRRLELRMRGIAEKRGTQFMTTELGATLWWAGMASHKATGAVQHIREKMGRNAWSDVFFEVHAMMHDTAAALSLLSVAERMIKRMESEGVPGSERPN
jgi:hypothetical protein